MNERLKYPIVMTIICLVAAAALAFTYGKTRDRIEASKRGELIKALEVVLPKNAKIEEKPVAGVTAEKLNDTDKVFVAVDEAGQALGYAAIGSAQGYSSVISVIVGLDLKGEIYAIRVLSQSETPGLGERTKEVPPTKTIWKALQGIYKKAPEEQAQAEPPFQLQFRGKNAGQLMLTTTPGSKDRIVQLTGATITSQAVVNAVREAVSKVTSTVKQ